MLPARRIRPKTLRAPSRSHSGPAMKRTKSVATRETMLELATCAEVRLRSDLIVTVSCCQVSIGDSAGSEYQDEKRLTSGGKVYHAQNAIMKPSHEKKKTRPCRSKGFSTGTLRALLLTGLTTGFRHRSEGLKPMLRSASSCAPLFGSSTSRIRPGRTGELEMAGLSRQIWTSHGPAVVHYMLSQLPLRCQSATVQSQGRGREL